MMSSASFIRSEIWARAQYISTSSSKTTVTTLRPKRLIERSSTTLGIDFTDCSIGYEMSCSTSWVASVGELVIICTWLLVISGSASIGRLYSENEPTTTSAKVNKPTINLLLMLK